MKKRGEIDLEYTKLEQKRLKFFTCGAHTLNMISFILGKNINQEGGGGAPGAKI